MNMRAVLATRFTLMAALLTVVVGGMVLVGWLFDISVLRSISPDLVSMKADAAVCFILTGIALLLTARLPEIFNPRRSLLLSGLARFFCLLVGLIGVLTLYEYISGLDPGIDQWLFVEPTGTVGTSFPGRMAPETALCFVLLAAALWIAGGSRKAIWAILASVNLGLVVVSLALAAMQSYFTSFLGPYGWFGLTIMAMPTAILLAMLGVAVIAISWQPDVLPWSLSGRTTTALACGMVLLVFIGLNTTRSEFWMKEINHQIENSEGELGDISNLLIEVIDAQTNTHSYIITGDERFKILYVESKANINGQLDRLRKLAADKPHQQLQLDWIDAQIKVQLKWLQQTIDVRPTDKANTTRNKILVHGEELLDGLRETFDQIEIDHQQTIVELKRESENVARFAYLTIAICTLTSLLIFFTVIFRLNFAVNERKRTEVSLQSMATKFRTMFGSSSDAIMLLDEKGFLDCNPSTLRIFGCATRDEFIGKHPTQVSPPSQPGGGIR